MRKLQAVQAEATKAEVKAKAITIPIGNTKSNVIQYRRCVLMSRPKVGKTSTAVTLSRLYDPAKVGKIWQDLSDTLVIEADKEGDLVLQANKISVDTIDLYSLVKPNGLLTDDLPGVLKAVIAAVEEQVQMGKRLVVLDTPSELGRSILDWFTRGKGAPRSPKTGTVDGYEAMRRDTQMHGWIHSKLTSLPCDLVFCIHTKRASEGFAERAKSDAMEGDTVDTVMDFYYTASANIYRRNMSLIANIQTDRQGRRWLYSRTKNGLEAGSRFGDILAEKEEPNLSKVYAKIDSHLQGEKK